MKSIFLVKACKSLEDKHGKEKAKEIYIAANKRYKQLCIENPNECKAVKKHTRKSIYPCIAMLDAMQYLGLSRETALEDMSKFMDDQSEIVAKYIRKLMKIPGIHKLTTKSFGNMTKKNFGEKANFKMEFRTLTKNNMHFDMVKCPYVDVCAKYGYFEIVKVYCRSDDILYGNMHKNLEWKRTKTIGNGDTICDFKIVRNEE